MRFSGIVKKNLGRGTSIGFPTANLEAPAGIEDGIYVGTALGKPALIFIGAAETYGDYERRAEVHILDFSGNLYDEEIEVEIFKRLRDNKKFHSNEDLIEQIKDDERVARRFFDGYNKDN